MDFQSKAPEASSASNNTTNLDVKNLMAEFATLKSLASTPKGQGQLDALLGKSSNSDGLEYQAGYKQMRSDILQAPPEVQQMVELIKQLPPEFCSIFD